MTVTIVQTEYEVKGTVEAYGETMYVLYDVNNKREQLFNKSDLKFAGVFQEVQEALAQA